MKKKILSALLCLVLLTALLPAALAQDVDTAANTGGKSVESSIFTSAVVQNTGASAAANGTPRQLEVVVKLKDFASPNELYAMVMPKADYVALFSRGPHAGNLDPTTYFKNSYAIGRIKVNKPAAGKEEHLILAAATTENDSMLGAGAPTGQVAFPLPQVSGKNYFETYTLVVFSTERGSDANYYVDDFYLDADGYVRTDSYLLAYRENNPTAGVGAVSAMPNPKNAIVRALPGGSLEASAPLSGAEPVRYGYKFQGWTEVAKGPLAATDPLPDAGFHQRSGNYATPEVLHTVYDLYALWRTVPVAFGGETLTAPGGQVGVAYAMEAQALAEGSDTRSSKAYSVLSAQWQVDGELVPVEKEGLLSDSLLPSGLQLQATDNTHWALTGTPLVDSDKPIVLTIQVKDLANGTTDTMTVMIPVIQKGRQEPPQLDWNTALQGRVVAGEATEGSDSAPEIGQLIGFYSPNEGAPDHSGKTYEYVPAALYDAAEEAEKAALWRTVALPEPGDDTLWPAEYGMVQAAVPNDWVRGGLPTEGPMPLEITTLPVGADYYIRFQATDTYVASDPVTVNTSGAVGGGGSGYALVFDLMGGALTWTDGAEHDTPPEDVYQPIALKTAEESVEIPTPPDGAALTKAGGDFGGWMSSDGTVYQAGDTVTLPGSSMALAAVWKQPSDYRSVTLLDWDDSIVGTTVIHKDATGPEIKAAVERLTAQLYRGDLSDLGKEDYLAAETWTQDNPAGMMLTGKKGYNFMGWVDVTAENMADTWTAYSAEDPYQPSTVFATPAAPEGGWDSLMFKAGYQENGFCNYRPEGSDMSADNRSLYTIVDNRFSYDRYGPATATAGDYNITFEVKRENMAGFGVTRLREPGVRLLFKIAANEAEINLYNLVVMENSDYQTITAVVPRLANSLTIEIVEKYGAPVYTAGKLSSLIPTVYAWQPTVGGPIVVNANGFIPAGTMSFINREMSAHITGMMESNAQNTSWSAQAPALTFEDAGLLDDNGKLYYLTHQPEQTITNAAQLLTIAKNKMSLFMVAVGMRDLSLEDMKAAIDMDLGPAKNSVAGQLPVAVNNIQLGHALRRLNAMYYNENNRNEDGSYRDLNEKQIKYAVTTKVTDEVGLQNFWCDP